jgi:hypothetical protein
LYVDDPDPDENNNQCDTDYSDSEDADVRFDVVAEVGISIYV